MFRLRGYATPTSVFVLMLRFSQLFGSIPGPPRPCRCPPPRPHPARRAAVRSLRRPLMQLYFTHTRFCSLRFSLCHHQLPSHGPPIEHFSYFAIPVDCSHLYFSIRRPRLRRSSYALCHIRSRGPRGSATMRSPDGTQHTVKFATKSGTKLHQSDLRSVGIATTGSRFQACVHGKRHARRPPDKSMSKAPASVPDCFP